MKKILFLLLPLAPALALAQTGTVKDSVRVLTTAEISAGNTPADTSHFYYIEGGSWKKVRMDSIARVARLKLAGNRGDVTVSSDGLTWDLNSGVVDSMQLSAGAVVLPGAKVTGTLPVSKGGTGNQTGLAATATALATGRTIQTNLASTSSATFDGTANITPGVTGQLPVGNGGTGTGTQFTAGSVVFAGAGGVYSQDNSGLFWDNANRRLGIKTSPTEILDVNGNARFRSLIYAADGSASAPSIRFYNSASGLFLPSGVDAIGFSVESSERMRITSAGDVGIGTGSPAVQFHTTGGVRFAGLATSGTSTYTVKADATGNLWYDSSDESYKKNISAIPYGIAAVMQLNPVAYNFVEDDEPDLGFIAQDIYNIIPELTYTAQDGKFGVKYDKLVSVLTKAIQEQQAQIEQLKQRITQLENK